jgi:transposase-like protein
MDAGKFTKEQRRLREMLVYPSHSSDPNYSNINKDFLKELKNQQDKEHVRIVLSWLDHGLFSGGWGLFSGKKFHGSDFSELTGADKKQVVSLLKTVREAFYENDFQPYYVSMDRENKKYMPQWSIDFMLKELGAKKNAADAKSLKLKSASEKLAKAEKLPRNLKKETKKFLQERGKSH